MERLDGDRDWARELCRIAVIWRDPGQVSIHDLFVAAAPDVSDRKAFETAVQRELLRNPELVDAWQGFGEDQRATPLPYLRGAEVGFCEEDGSVSSTFTHQDHVSACADYLFRETAWVLKRQRISGPHTADG